MKLFSAAAVAFVVLLSPMLSSPTIIVPRTGVWSAICINGEYTIYPIGLTGGITRISKDCCAAIGGGKHYFDESQHICTSFGGLAFRRVWWEAFRDCCEARGTKGKALNLFGGGPT